MQPAMASLQVSENVLAGHVRHTELAATFRHVPAAHAGCTVQHAGEPSPESTCPGVSGRVGERCINLKCPKAGRATVSRRAVSNSLLPSPATPWSLFPALLTPQLDAPSRVPGEPGAEGPRAEWPSAEEPSVEESGAEEPGVAERTLPDAGPLLPPLLTPPPEEEQG
eukprot:3467431-Rhodomonas_salina.1